MHLIFYIRGLKSQVSLLEHFLESQFFKWKRVNNLTKEVEYNLVQGGLRQTVLGAYEYIFPEEALADVLAMMNLNEGHVGAEGSIINKSKIIALRKIFGASKIDPATWEKARKIPKNMMFNNSERALADVLITGTAIHLIGIKKDTYNTMTRKLNERGIETDFPEGYYQEML